MSTTYERQSPAHSACDYSYFNQRQATVGNDLDGPCSMLPRAFACQKLSWSRFIIIISVGMACWRWLAYPYLIRQAISKHAAHSSISTKMMGSSALMRLFCVFLFFFIIRFYFPPIFQSDCRLVLFLLFVYSISETPSHGFHYRHLLALRLRTKG